MVARQRGMINRVSPDGSRTVTYLPSLATTCTDDPALRASCPPFPGLSSTLCTCVPSGMFARGSVLPGRMSTLSPEMTTSPTLTPTGCRM